MTYTQFSCALFLFTSLSLSVPQAAAAPVVDLYGTFNAMGITVDFDATDDPNGNARATVEYRTGSSTFKRALPLARISNTRFAGSLFALTADSTVAVRIVFADPDGGALNGLTLRAVGRTRADLRVPAAGPNRYIVSATGKGTACSSSAPCALETAIDRATAGQSIVLQGGTYYTGDITLPRSGTANAPIVIRAQASERVILDGADPAQLNWRSVGGGVYQATTPQVDAHLVVADGRRLLSYRNLDDLRNLFWGVPGSYADGAALYVRLQNNRDPNTANVVVARHNKAFRVSQNYIYFVGLTFRHYGFGDFANAIYFDGGSDNLVTDCTFALNDTAIGLKRDANRNVIQDSRFRDSIFAWPWAALKTPNRSDPLTEAGAIEFYGPTSGQGNVIRRNQLQDMFDGFGACPGSAGSRTNETDVYDNVISRIADDGISTDGVCSNVRLWGNTVHTALVGISLAPTRTGPTYAVRNLIYNIGAGDNEFPGSAFKFNSGDGGSGPMYLYHNTVNAVRSATSAIEIKSPGSWSNLIARNNIWAGTDYALKNVNVGQPVDLDFNNLYSSTPGNLALWDGVAFADLASFSSATGQERNGTSAEPGFLNAANARYELAADSALIDGGLVIAGINDDYQGAAPDLGAFEASNRVPGRWFTAAPALLAQIQTTNNETSPLPDQPSTPWLTAAVSKLDAAGVRLALERAEVATGAVNQTERIGFLVMATTPSGTLVDEAGAQVTYSSQLSAASIVGWDNGCTPIRLDGSFSTRPIVLASQVTRNGTDGGWLRRCSLTANQAGLLVDEDSFQDPERAHTGEAAGLVSFSQPFSARFGSGAQAWQLQAAAVALGSSYGRKTFDQVVFDQAFATEPLVFVLPTSRGDQPATVRIRNVSRTGFELAQVEPPGEDGGHVAMTVHFLAITPGVHQLPDGTRISAGSVDSRAVQQGGPVPGVGSWTNVNFSGGLSASLNGSPRSAD